jgi:hypothetical protein
VTLGRFIRELAELKAGIRFHRQMPQGLTCEITGCDEGSYVTKSADVVELLESCSDESFEDLAVVMLRRCKAAMTS